MCLYVLHLSTNTQSENHVKSPIAKNNKVKDVSFLASLKYINSAQAI